MSFSPAPSSFRPPTAAATGVATSSGLEQQQQPKQFNIGTVSPKRSRIATKKPSVEKRSVNYKKGIDSIENRKLRRTKLGEHRSQDRTRRISQRRRSGENNGQRGNTNTNSISNSSSKSITNNSTNTSKIEPSNPRTEKKVYTGSAKSPSKSSFVFAMTSFKDSGSGIVVKKSSPTTTITNGTPSKSVGCGGSSAFAAYASPGMVSFGSLATPKKGSTIFGFGSFNKPSIFGDNNKSTSKGRTTITSLRTLSYGFRALGDGDDDICDSDDMMECD